MPDVAAYTTSISIGFQNAPKSITSLLFSSLTGSVEKDVDQYGYLIAFYRKLTTYKTYKDLDTFIKKRLARYGNIETSEAYSNDHLKELYGLDDFQVEEVRRLVEDYVSDILAQTQQTYR